MHKPNLALIFGARSPEHEVSIVTAFQAWEWIDPKKYRRFLIYIDRENQAYLCPTLKKKNYHRFIEKTQKRAKKIRFVKGGFVPQKGFASKKIRIDVALLSMHGTFGEDGRIQGLLDFLDIPHTSSGVLGSAVGMDKVVAKKIFSAIGLPVSAYLWFYFEEFKTNPRGIVKEIEAKLRYPLFVKPARAGSSVGISKVDKKKDLNKAINLAGRFDYKILVEEAIQNAVDINCAVIGFNEKVEVSVCEQPISEDKFLSFKEKYLKGGKTKGMAGLSRIVPAPISEKVSRKIQEMAKLIFREIDCAGIARVDFLFQKSKNKIYPNEINTIPGSLSYYLWEATGIKPKEMIDRLVKLALARKKETNELDYIYQSKILDQK